MNAVNRPHQYCFVLLGGAKKLYYPDAPIFTERKQFKQKLADFEALQFRFADMLTDLDARADGTSCCCSLDHKNPEAIMHSHGKTLATDLCFNIVNQALQNAPAVYGYIREYPLNAFP